MHRRSDLDIDVSKISGVVKLGSFDPLSAKKEINIRL
jgi:hypothetical protein